MLEKSYSKSAHAISSVIAALALMLFALSYGFASPAYAADATASSSATASKLIAGEKGAVTVATSATSGNYKPMTLENAKGTIHLYPLFYDKESKSVYLFFDLNSRYKTDDEPTNVSSSNPKVCTADPGYGCLSLSYDKVGKTTVSYTWKGKRHKVKFVVHKWTNPVKSFTVGGRQYSSKYKSSNVVKANSKFLTGKVKVKAAKGWKVTSIVGVKGNYGEKKIKSGKTNLKKSDKVRGITVRVKNKASGQELWLDLTGKKFIIPF